MDESTLTIMNLTGCL